MANKHDTRKLREKSIRSIQRPLVRKPGSGTIVQPERGPQLVRITQGMYDTLPPDATSFYVREGVAPFKNQAVGVVTSMVQFTVPSGLVLDISQVQFAFLLGQTATGLYSVGDYALLPYLLWGTKIAGLSPLDMQTDSYGTIASGSALCNRNLMDNWGDVPVHLIAYEGDTVELLMTHLGTPIEFHTGQFAFYQIHGRWIPKSLWDDISFANRVS